MSNSLLLKLTKIMGEIDHVDKRGKNVAQDYNYVKAADIARVVRKKMAAAGILMLSDVVKHESFITQAREGKTPQTGIHILVKYTLYDAETGEQLSFHGFGSGVDSGEKAIYKAHTGALKYALRNTFLLPDEAGDPEYDGGGIPPAPEPYTGVVRKFGIRGDTVYVDFDDRIGSCSTDPNKSRLLESEGKTFELLMTPTKGKSKGKPIFLIHQVFPVPDAKEAVSA